MDPQWTPDPAGEFPDHCGGLIMDGEVAEMGEQEMIEAVTSDALQMALWRR